MTHCNNSADCYGFVHFNGTAHFKSYNPNFGRAVSNNTDILVTSDISSDSSKLVKAKQLNITILSKEDFYKLIL